MRFYLYLSKFDHKFEKIKRMKNILYFLIYYTMFINFYNQKSTFDVYTIHEERYFGQKSFCCGQG